MKNAGAGLIIYDAAFWNDGDDAAGWMAKLFLLLFSRVLPLYAISE